MKGDMPVQTPILSMLLDYIKTNPLSFHVPGHRNGKGYSAYIEQLDKTLEQYDYIVALQKIMEIDITELAITDDLHQPEGAIKTAQRLAAELYGVKHSFFLVGGSTVGNIVSILSTCEPGDTIIVQRNVHKSVINGCKLAGVHIVFVYPELEEQSGYTTIPSYNSIKRAIQLYPQAKAVFLTSPNYYGMSIPLEQYSELIHAYHMLFIVDEAHGAHYGLHANLPKSAIQYGADIVVHSTHKTLPAFTMSAMLHVNSERVNLDIVQEQLMIMQSSSPSFVLLAGLDLARAIIQDNGTSLLEQSLSVQNKLRADCEQLKLSIAIEEYSSSHIQYDPLRLHVFDREKRLNGSELQTLLEQQGIWVEMCSHQHCILVLHLGYTEVEYESLLKRLIALDNQLKTMSNVNKQVINKRVSSYYNSNQIDEPVLLKRGVHRQTQLTPFSDAIGEICGETITPYPPGIPLLYIGETISAEKLEEIRSYIEYGYNIQANSQIYDGFIKIIVN